MRAKYMEEGLQHQVKNDHIAAFCLDSETFDHELCLTMQLFALLGPANCDVGSSSKIIRIKYLMNQYLGLANVQDWTDRYIPLVDNLKALKEVALDIYNQLHFLPCPATRFHAEKMVASLLAKLHPELSAFLYCTLEFRVIKVNGRKAESVSAYLTANKTNTLGKIKKLSSIQSDETSETKGENTVEIEETPPCTDEEQVELDDEAMMVEKEPGVMTSNNATLDTLCFDEEGFRIYDSQIPIISAFSSTPLSRIEKEILKNVRTTIQNSNIPIPDYGLAATISAQQRKQGIEFMKERGRLKEEGGAQNTAEKLFQSTLVTRTLAVHKALAFTAKDGKVRDKIDEVLNSSNSNAQNVARHVQGYLTITLKVSTHIEEYIKTGNLRHWIAFLSVVALVSAASGSANNVKWIMGSLSLLAWFDDNAPEYLKELAIAIQVVDDWYSECKNAQLKRNIKSDVPHNTMMNNLKTYSVIGPILSVLETLLDIEFGQTQKRKGAIGRSNPTSSINHMRSTEKATLDKNVKAIDTILVEILDLAGNDKLVMPPYVDILEFGSHMLPRLHLHTAANRLQKL